MIELNMLKLSEYRTLEIELALKRNKKIIAEKLPNTRASAKFWKAVENRQKLIRELTVRGEVSNAAAVLLPANHLPLLTIEGSEQI